ncbi:hypothetical protein [Rhizobium ruizarguesonis]|uniref:hypothetical protein n=1 Tax=Rhizobium ruizarguesonis TaxID=2081791 RepID=UPI0010306FDB|nr:hypothetical protein [Rhizobium ruizarguesonis]MBY5891499.1 hypothetical protein [Rhizobium leguminosarum]QSZ04584.1 hypothetical protein J3P73_28720 [Rhizobium ruizarguesonis]TBA07701.1 hypothetical protein ELH65_38205 [Rhizobium ruizarguesonis]
MRSDRVLKLNSGSNLNTWSGHPDIEAVNGRLSSEDEKFFHHVGRLLARAGQANRFAVTLLHSHFSLTGGEVLVDRFDRKRNLIITSVEPANGIQDREEMVAKSWSFPSDGTDDQIVEIDVLTWINSNDLPNRPLDNRDAVLIRAIAAIFRGHGVEKRFGMTLVGQRAEAGSMWVEGDVPSERYLVQEQIDLIDVEERNSIKTMWAFDDSGKHVIVLGCCRRTQSGNGHTGSKHGPGW